MSTLALAVVLGLPPAGSVEPTEVDGGEAIEVVVEPKQRPDWLFPGLDHPRVQAYFRSGSSTGSSLIGAPVEPVIRPLVRAGSIKVHDAISRVERRVIRRFVRELVDEVRPALEACYVDSLGRTPTEVARLTVRVELSRQDRGPVLVSDGLLGDLFGNACAHSVLEFADAKPPRLDASLEIPLWFWLQTDYGAGAGAGAGA